MSATLEPKWVLVALVAAAAAAVIGFAVGSASKGDAEASALESAPAAAGSVAISGIGDAGPLPDLRPAPEPASTASSGADTPVASETTETAPVPTSEPPTTEPAPTTEPPTTEPAPEPTEPSSSPSPSEPSSPPSDPPVISDG